MKTRSNLKELPLPSFYKAANASSYAYGPNAMAVQSESHAWRAAHGLSAAATDSFNLHLLLIDVQKDFCFPEGSLYVAGRSGRGAIDDNRRIAEFIHKNLGALTNVTTTLDTHFAYQIFFPSFWLDKADQPVRAEDESWKKEFVLD